MDASHSGTNEYVLNPVHLLSLKRFSGYETAFADIDSNLKIPIEKLTLGPEIGRGNFGVVIKGTYCNDDGTASPVACKTFDSQCEGTITGIKEFLREGLIMANFCHPNVLRLNGIALTSNGYPVIVTDYLANGDLHHYVADSELSFETLVSFCIDVVEGMAYLHEKNFIHRDLAARNCMLNENLVVKVADFGLSRDVSRYGVYEAVDSNRAMPLRWMSLESIEKQEYTFKGDVWAYGVVVWELLSKGTIPYGSLEAYDILQLLRKGERLHKPKSCPTVMYNNIMLECWREDPSKRPFFSELRETMRNIVTEDLGEEFSVERLKNRYERLSAALPTDMESTSLLQKTDRVDACVES